LQANLAVFLNQRGYMSDNNLAWYFTRAAKEEGNSLSWNDAMDKVQDAKTWPIDNKTKTVAKKCYGVNL